MADGLRLAIGTLTAVPVRPPTTVGRAQAAAAMLLAPVVGALLGAAATAAGWAALHLVGLRGPGTPVALAALLGGITVVGVLALMTRGIHLDGLADTADGHGSGRHGEEALAVMRRSDIGPSGVVALLLVLALQVVSVAVLLARDDVSGVVVAVAAGRLALVWACRRGVPAARPDGLGAAVAGSVAPGAAMAVTVVTALAAGALDWWPGAAAVALACLAGVVVVARARRRWGGITGDVLGAVVETATTVGLLTLVVLGG